MGMEMCTATADVIIHFNKIFFVLIIFLGEPLLHNLITLSLSHSLTPSLNRAASDKGWRATFSIYSPNAHTLLFQLRMGNTIFFSHSCHVHCLMVLNHFWLVNIDTENVIKNRFIWHKLPLLPFVTLSCCAAFSFLYHFFSASFIFPNLFR